MRKKISILIFALIALILLTGIYRFNFTNDDIYVLQEDGKVVSYAQSQSNDE